MCCWFKRYTSMGWTSVWNGELSQDYVCTRAMVHADVNTYPTDTWRNNNDIITSKRRRDIAMT